MSAASRPWRGNIPRGPFDAVIVGGGHNGLICAAYLARAKKRVLVLERRSVLGGAAVNEEIYPGFTFTTCAYLVSLLRPRIVRELELPRHGYAVLPVNSTFLPLPDGGSLFRPADPADTREEIARFSRKDADAYPLFGQTMSAVSRFVKEIIDHPAVEPLSLDPRRIRESLRLARCFRDLPTDLRYALLKLTTQSAADYLDTWFESDVLKGALSTSGVIGTFLGVRSPGTAYVMLHHYMGEIDGEYRAWGFVKGGIGAVSLSAARGAAAAGAEIRTEAAVAHVRVKNGKADGVVLADGAEIDAGVVCSSADPRRTFFDFVGRGHLPGEIVQNLERIRFRGCSGKVNLAVDRVPVFACRPGDGPHLRGDINIAPGLDYMQAAYIQAKGGVFSEKPFLNVVIPSLVDPTLAPPGKHVVSIFAQYAPYAPAGGPQTWPAKREAFGDAVVDTLAEYCPELKSSILYRHVLTPWDLEKEYGLTEGNIFHGELRPEQLLWFRPIPGWSRYKTPIHRLWLCGSGTHPGGGVMGAPGELAAKTILRERAI